MLYYAAYQVPARRSAIVSGVHSALASEHVDTSASFSMCVCSSMNFHLRPRLRMRSSVSILPYFFMMWRTIKGRELILANKKFCNKVEKDL